MNPRIHHTSSSAGGHYTAESTRPTNRGAKSKFLSRKLLFPIFAFIFLDLLAVGAGMGVPIFAILLGFFVGWFMPSILADNSTDMQRLLRNCLTAAFLTASFTLLLMLILWGPSIRMLFDPSADIVNFGIPLILYEPKASLIGWLVLMIVISPFLQALASIFGSSVRLAWRPPASFRKFTTITQKK